ncbi:MAG: hypothetical protein QF457_12660, partial [SAR324 cluster bacterium]|nr:hypothetical protein [SAR324 cluster bacterium]
RFFIGSWLGQMTLDLHQTFRIGQDWSFAPSKNFGEHAHARTHAQEAQMCMQFSNFFGGHFEALPD